MGFLAGLRAYLIGIFLASLFVLAPNVLAQVDITLRFIEADSGKPIVGMWVSVSAWDENGNQGRQPPPAGVAKIDKNTQSIKTDKKGEAVFRLYAEPALKTLYVDTVGDLRGCYKPKFSIDEVKASGVVASYDSSRPKWCVPLKVQATAKPGEVVILDKKMTVWDRMRREIP
jgi:hypothetical protein